MSDNRPAAIRPHHLERRAYVYVRQSTEEQVIRNTGSTEYQRGQIHWPLAWGWRADRVVVVEDLGLSGSCSLQRNQYLEMRDYIRAGQVGLICASDHTRVGRDTQEWFSLVADCATFDVPIAIDGRIADLRDTNDRFFTGLMAMMAEHENRMRRDTMQRGRLARARAGRAVSAPPIGYIKGSDASWQLDPDPAVRAALHACFREFLKYRTLRRTIIALRELGLQIPRRRPGRPVHWIAPVIHALQDILHNPAYVGDYCFRKRRDDPRKGRSDKGRYRVRLATPEEVIRIADHHEPYVTREQWAEIQDVLRANRWSRERSNPGPGIALLQGIIRCGQHGLSMHPHYKKQGLRSYCYRCKGDYDTGGSGVHRLPGHYLDRAVAHAALQRLSPLEIDILRDAWRSANSDEDAVQRQRDIERRRRQRAVEDLEEKFFSVDAENAEVAKLVEKRLEQAKQDLLAFDSIHLSPCTKGSSFDEEAFDELQSLARSLDAIWVATTTTTHDRKELLRTLIRHVVVQTTSRQEAQLCIQWADDHPDTSLSVVLPAGRGTLAAELASTGIGAQRLGSALTERGALPARTQNWTLPSVKRLLRRGPTNGNENGDDSQAPWQNTGRSNVDPNKKPAKATP